ncbi:MAG TPA: peptidoglycan-associated lipoprotein Pal [Dongiaceae bacterium]|nr:peptidoglycan-associated lipoprotein Pal [Dongiaceae bacterium]
MKTKYIFNLLSLGLVLTSLATTGCHKRPATLTPLPGARTGHIGDVPPTQPLGFDNNTTTSTGIPPVGNPIPMSKDGHVGWIPNTDALKAETVYFDFDSSAIKSGEQSKIDNVAAYLNQNPQAAVRVEGNCDERGTEEYNRSLGERRALAVREYLVRAGVAADRVDTVSYGEDRPAVPGHDEAAYKMNRRDDFVVLTPPQ